VDALLKKEFDIHRAKGTAHPLMKKYKIDAVPFTHENLSEWRHNFTGVSYFDEATNFEIFGAVDDLWIAPSGEIIIVDYKATSKDEEVSLDADWQIGYKRQMEVYQWLFKKNGFKVSPTGYFVYCNGKKDREAFDGKLEFDISVIPYEGDDSWVSETVSEIKKTLDGAKIPGAGKDCDYCAYRKAAAEKSA
jgi:CRISPR/Cas system-associated exonuclease Cas4 (RecB family)